jgi:hypothetical protein
VTQPGNVCLDLFGLGHGRISFLGDVSVIDAILGW